MANETSIRVPDDIDARVKAALAARGVVLPDTVTARTSFVLGDWLGMVTPPVDIGVVPQDATQRP